jgi:dimethylargininase
MWTALTRALSTRIRECELTFIDRVSIDVPRAQEQHQNYQELLRSLGIDVIEIPADHKCPDCCFIEDTALVLDEVAIITRPGSRARRREVEGVAQVVKKYRSLIRIQPPATLEGGDVLRVGRDLFVGLTTRTNRRGIEALRAAVGPYGYRVVVVPVPRALHLKSVCTAVDERVVLADSTRMNTAAFSGYTIIQVPADEWMAANVLRINGKICMHSGFRRTIDLLRKRGLEIRTVDISEFLKAEAGLTCMSVLFRTIKSEARAN